MAVNREALFSALYARLQSIAGFNYSSRTFESWDDTSPPERPAFFLVKGAETSVVRFRLPPQWTLEARMVIYCSNDGTHQTPPSTQINNLLQSIEAQLRLQQGEVAQTQGPVQYATAVQGYTWWTTLGGLCHQCAIEGTVEVFEGVIANTAVAIVPIVIRVDGW